MSIYDPTSLDRDLRAAGLAIDGCDTSGRIAWLPGHPTPPEQAKANAVMAAHNPDAPAKAEAARRAVVAAALVDLAGPDQVKWRAAVTTILRILAR